MKKILFLLLITLPTINCSSKKQFITNENTQGELSAETIPQQEKASKSLADSKVLYFVDGKESNAKAIKKINPDNIETVTVIKNKDDIGKYTSEEYDGVILIVTKKG
ncbi:hypothetical protein [uncultured Dokdonia sp.]|uniref:hypothetical protein n=1 Tax=uncultured Dokdonia sp. TaxID=575653 RepID=UPI00261AB4CE|nr:hypothetical protein [uncultured Dokdonia sp.]